MAYCYCGHLMVRYASVSLTRQAWQRWPGRRRGNDWQVVLYEHYGWAKAEPLYVHRRNECSFQNHLPVVAPAATRPPLPRLSGEGYAGVSDHQVPTVAVSHRLPHSPPSARRETSLQLVPSVGGREKAGFVSALLTLEAAGWRLASSQ